MRFLLPALLLPFNYYPGSKTRFAHSLPVTVLNGEGEINHQQSGLSVDRSGGIFTLEKPANAIARR